MPILNSRAEGKDENGQTVPARDFLAGIGPIIPITLAIPDGVLQAYSKRGERPPSPVSGFAMIDTGATATCVDIDVAKKAGLPIIGEARMTSAAMIIKKFQPFQENLLARVSVLI